MRNLKPRDDECLNWLAGESGTEPKSFDYQENVVSGTQDSVLRLGDAEEPHL